MKFTRTVDAAKLAAKVDDVGRIDRQIDDLIKTRTRLVDELSEMIPYQFTTVSGNYFQATLEAVGPGPLSMRVYPLPDGLVNFGASQIEKHGVEELQVQQNKQTRDALNYVSESDYETWQLYNHVDHER